MTRCAQSGFQWFAPPPDDGWSCWKWTATPRRAELGGGGARGAEGRLECAAWLPNESAGKRPLVIVLHGCGQSSDDIDDELGWKRLAGERRFGVMFIRETGEGDWSPLWWGPAVERGCFDWFDLDGAKRNEGQPAAIAQAASKLAADRPDVVDPAQIFVVGFSAGAGMAALLLTAWPDVFAGAGIVAGPAVGVAETQTGGWAAYVAPQLMYWPDSMRRWAADIRAESCRFRGVRPGPWPRKAAIWHGEADPVVNRGHAAALVDQFAGMMGIPVSRHWSWFMPRMEISGQTASHSTRLLQDPLGGGRRSLRRIVFADPETGEALIQANWIDYLGHAAPVAPSLDPLGQVIGENERRKYVGVDSTAEMLDFFGVAAPTGAIMPSAAKAPTKPAKPAKKVKSEG